ncbi:MAG: ribosomal-processing cysteine protease Prp, partial [Bacilli bacterium]|nr:ribosomal-processing cysteine protease Prp [Bacilli bacterium]
MIKVYIKDKTIIIKGHAGYDIAGKDIVCASASAIVITSINAALRFDDKSLKYLEEKDKLSIDILSDDKSVLLII